MMERLGIMSGTMIWWQSMNLNTSTSEYLLVVISMIGIVTSVALVIVKLGVFQ